MNLALAEYEHLAIVGCQCLAGNALAQVMVAQAIRSHPDAFLLTGDAVGIDTMVVEEAVRQGREHRRFVAHAGRLIRAKTRQERWRVYKSRNQAVVAACTHLLRISCPGSPTFGSGWTQQYAQAKGKVILPEIVIRCSRHQDA